MYMFFRDVVILDCHNNIHQHSLCTEHHEINVFVLDTLFSPDGIALFSRILALRWREKLTKLARLINARSRSEFSSATRRL